MIAGVILAAGSASRMGKTKQILPFKGNTILGCVIENARRSRVGELVVVIGSAADEVLKKVDFTGVEVLVNQDYLRGQSTSLKLGLKAVAERCEGVIFLLGDQPLVGSDVIDQLIEAFYHSAAAIIIPTYDGKRGNPVLIRRTLFSALEKLSGDVGARKLFKEYAHEIKEVEVSSQRVLLDIDEWQDYVDLQGKE
ncbi:MAG: molybdenum cofactor cytidylyltransferase [Desulfitobacteriaceae bacterium]|nr:molybdenum cofactor cytidylyltransferase [Desulfitobacteriaceae bacterium]MDD4752166.1 molybdenum cofactor cytidylyltransferase [Desulfitobacteriaceae bacterium]